MTWAGERGERFCSFQSPGLFFPLTLPFIEHDLGWRARRTFLLLPVAGVVFSLDSPLYRTRLPEMWGPRTGLVRFADLSGLPIVNTRMATPTGLPFAKRSASAASRCFAAQQLPCRKTDSQS